MYMHTRAYIFISIVEITTQYFHRNIYIERGIDWALTSLHVYVLPTPYLDPTTCSRSSLQVDSLFMLYG